MVTLDTNIAFYAFDDVSPKAPIARTVLARADFLSVQVLNEFVNATARKQRRSWSQAAWAVSRIRAVVSDIRSIEVSANAEALRLAERYRLSFYDSLMLAVALAGGARTIYSEDMQHDMLIDGTLRIVDPFR